MNNIQLARIHLAVMLLEQHHISEHDYTEAWVLVHTVTHQVGSSSDSYEALVAARGFLQGDDTDSYAAVAALSIAIQDIPA